MSIYVRDLQDRINEKAQKLAEERWKQDAKNFPFWDGDLEYQGQKISRYHLMALIEKQAVQRYKQEEINRLSKEIIEAYENVENLKSQLEDIQHG